ncbi:hypothetical protein RCH07_000252 [Arthrobacter sp. CG_A4]|nr:hypothetical protein [Arthrobacter sp. CG_A4]
MCFGGLPARQVTWHGASRPPAAGTPLPMQTAYERAPTFGRGVLLQFPCAVPPSLSKVLSYLVETALAWTPLTIAVVRCSGPKRASITTAH